ncbi:MAG: 4-(cytidine 5'-diphospho)-2-C-methyl-D-erythritol kinase [Verrucomicrobia bacterium]|nr:4-(cytidine 5'-diphospho)-2-C-methyl-D-erythritol kinase [Verrucomicrobiota bacterium]
MLLELPSPCKVNLLLNVLGKRPDGFHELETVMHPLPLCDRLMFSRAPRGVHLSCSDPRLPTDAGNLVHRTATAFLAAAGIADGVRIHLEKHVPLAAGLGGGSSNAAATLAGLNDLFEHPLPPERLSALAADLGSDVPFFLQNRPALATGRGEQIQPLEPFRALQHTAFLLVHPGFGISTGWAYQQLARFPAALNGQPGRARQLADVLQTGTLEHAAPLFYNALETPALEKYPILGLYQEFLRAEGAAVTLMSGSGSTTFALAAGEEAARKLAHRFTARFGPAWTAVLPAGSSPLR